jgi:hypothetical protein
MARRETEGTPRARNGCLGWALATERIKRIAFMADPDTDAERAALIAASTVRQQSRRRTDLITPLIMALLVVGSVAVVYMMDPQPSPNRPPLTSPPAATQAPAVPSN